MGTRVLLLAAAFVVLFGPEGFAAERHPAAIDALKNMSAYLRTIQRFEITTQSSTDSVTDSGQTLTFGHESKLDIALPNKMRIEVVREGQRRQLVYDGKDFAIYRTAQRYYAQEHAPPTVDGLVGVLAQRYNIETPLADLFNWGLDKGALDAITGALVVGQETIAGTRCTHYAFHQQDVDWQIWISADGPPLPRQLILTGLKDSARPRHFVRLQWNLKPAFSPATFVIAPPANARRIAIVAR